MRKITSSSNPYIKELKSFRSKKHRDKAGKYIVEGEKIVLEALASAALIESVVTCEARNQAAMDADKAGLDVILVPRQILVSIADTKTPPDVLACLKRESGILFGTGRFYVVADGIQDPKNLGTIIRTADAAGADGVMISDDSADPYGPKCQRAAMGSTFHLTVQVGDAYDFMERFKKEAGQEGLIVAGMLEGTTLRDDQRFTKVCVVIGNESRGVSEKTRKLADLALRIPIYGRAESLNAAVAAGIMMYDIRKRLRG